MLKKSGLRMTEEDLAKIVGASKSKMGSGKGWDEPETKPAKKRRGTDEKPILSSLKDCVPEVFFGSDFAAFVFRGTKMFTLNDIYAIKEFRPYVDYQYKSAWHKLIENAVLLAGGKSVFPDFSNGCALTVFRQSSKKVDRDALAIMFKYAIDGLRYSKIIPDDNSDVVRDVRPFQRIGEPMAIVRIDAYREAEREVDEKTLVESSTSVWLA